MHLQYAPVMQGWPVPIGVMFMQKVLTFLAFVAVWVRPPSGRSYSPSCHDAGHRQRTSVAPGRHSNAQTQA